LVELNKAVDNPASKIASVVSQIRSSVHDAIQAFKAFYKRVQGNCKTGQHYLQTFKAKLQGDLSSTNGLINSAQNSLKKNQAAAASLAKKLSAAKEELKSAHERQEKEEAHYRAIILEAYQKLVVIRHVRNIVVDELLNGKAPASLLQVNTVSQKLQELKTLVEKDEDSMFSSVVATLIEMVSERNLNDQNILRKFIAALDKLKKSIKRWRSKSKADHKNIKRLNEANNAAKLKSIRALGRLLVEARSGAIGASRAIEELSNARDLITAAIGVKTREEKQWQELCDDQERVAKIFQTAHANLKSKIKTAAAHIFNLQ